MGLSQVGKTQADLVTFDLVDVYLTPTRQMTGSFDWTYNAGDFENGSGQFSSLVIPWTAHNQDDLDAMFDIGKSIEIVYPGSVHDDGVDITLFLLEPLTPTTGSFIDLARSKYEIGGNGFHDGFFHSGIVSRTGVVPEPHAFHLALLGLAAFGFVRSRRRSAVC